MSEHVILCQPLISEHDAKAAHALLLRFCCAFETSYGAYAVTPNMHLHTHLLECILDYGPIYSFWLFSFERYNGLLGSYHTNQRSVEMQVMRKFLLDLKVQELVSTEPFDTSLQHLLRNLLERKQVGSAQGTHELYTQSESASNVHLPQQQISPSADYLNLTRITCVPPYTMEMINPDSVEYLKQAYSTVLPNINLSQVPSLYQCYREIEVGGERIGSTRSRLDRSCFIQAHWVQVGGQINTPPTEFCLRPGIIDYFCQQRLLVGSSSQSVLMACVRWLQPHPSRSLFGSPHEVWSYNVFEPYGPASYMPIQRVHNQFVSCKIELSGEHVLVVCPLPRKIYM